jgi:hypothetical protein
VIYWFTKGQQKSMSLGNGILINIIPTELISKVLPAVDMRSMSVNIRLSLNHAIRGLRYMMHLINGLILCLEGFLV